MKIKRNNNWLWGILFLLIAGFIVASQLGWIAPFGIRTFVAGAFAVVILSHCITRKTITPLPFVIALVYIILRNVELVPHVGTGALLLAAWLTAIGLRILFPKKKHKRVFTFTFNGKDSVDKEKRRAKAFANMGELNDNPTFTEMFGAASHYIQADNLQTVNLSCHFGGMDIYLDQAQLSENGAVIDLECKFGGIDIYVPRHWKVNEQINCTLGGADVNGRSEVLNENSPQLTITGNVMFGGVDINYI